MNIIWITWCLWYATRRTMGGCLLHEKTLKEQDAVIIFSSRDLTVDTGGNGYI
jgi:hypothetical protein